MKIEQKLVVDGITTTLSVEVPLQAVKTLHGDEPAAQEFLGMEYDIRQEAHPHICKVLSSVLLETHHQVYGSLLKLVLERSLFCGAEQVPGISCQPGGPQTS